MTRGIDQVGILLLTVAFTYPAFAKSSPVHSTASTNLLSLTPSPTGNSLLYPTLPTESNLSSLLTPGRMPLLLPSLSAPSPIWLRPSALVPQFGKRNGGVMPRRWQSWKAGQSTAWI